MIVKEITSKKILSRFDTCPSQYVVTWRDNFYYQLVYSHDLGVSIDEALDATDGESMHGWFIHIWLGDKTLTVDELKTVYDAASKEYDLIGISFSKSVPKKIIDRNIYVDL